MKIGTRNYHVTLFGLGLGLFMVFMGVFSYLTDGMTVYGGSTISSITDFTECVQSRSNPSTVIAYYNNVAYDNVALLPQEPIMLNEDPNLVVEPQTIVVLDQTELSTVQTLAAYSCRHRALFSVLA